MSTAKKTTDAEKAAATQPASEGVVNTGLDPQVEAEKGSGPGDRRDPPANQYDKGGAREGEARRDEASGAIMTGEDEKGRPLTTEAVAEGAEPVAPGYWKERRTARDEGDSA